MIRSHLIQSGPKSNLGRTVRGHLDVGSLRPPRRPDWAEKQTDSVSVLCEGHSLGILLVPGIMGGPVLNKKQKSWVSGGLWGVEHRFEGSRRSKGRETKALRRELGEGASQGRRYLNLKNKVKRAREDKNFLGTSRAFR